MPSPSINFPFYICAKNANPRTGNHYRKHPGFFALRLRAVRPKVRYSSVLQAKHKYPVELLAFPSMTRETVNTFMCCDSLVSPSHGDILFDFTHFR